MAKNDWLIEWVSKMFTSLPDTSVIRLTGETAKLSKGSCSSSLFFGKIGT